MNPRRLVPPRSAPIRRAPPAAYARIYATVRRIPRGRVATYGTIARLAGLAGHARRIGYALHALPTGTDLPWHRVLNAKGELSLARLNEASGREQRRRLEAEGVRFDARGRVDLKRHAWRFRGQ